MQREIQTDGGDETGAPIDLFCERSDEGIGDHSGESLVESVGICLKWFGFRCNAPDRLRACNPQSLLRLGDCRRDCTV